MRGVVDSGLGEAVKQRISDEHPAANAQTVEDVRRNRAALQRKIGEECSVYAENRAGGAGADRLLVPQHAGAAPGYSRKQIQHAKPAVAEQPFDESSTV